MPPRPRATRRRLAAAALLIVVLAIVALMLARQGSPTRAAAGAAVPVGETTTTVTRRTLSESETIDGTLGFGEERDVYGQLGGTFTWLPGAGHVVARGGTLYRLDDLPVVLMYGSVPAYRTLAQGASDGPDVSELNRNLVALGYDPYGAIGDYEAFSAATAAAVKRWQHAEGLPETGSVQLGRVTFAPGALRITTVHVSLGQDPPASSSPEEPEGAKKEEPKDKEKEKPADEKASHDHENKPGGSEEEGSEDEGNGSQEEGGGGGGGELVLSATATRQLVAIKVKAEQQQLARVGERAPVTLPGGRTVQGRVIDVGTVASSSGSEEKGGDQNEGESPTIAVTLALRRPVAHLDQAPVSVELLKSVRRHVLTVPAPALAATAGGGYAVQALRAGRPVAVPVTPGMYADGYVEVDGPGVHAGMTVLEPR